MSELKSGVPDLNRQEPSTIKRLGNPDDDAGPHGRDNAIAIARLLAISSDEYAKGLFLTVDEIRERRARKQS
ncbi:type II toxin-antitoxin system Phd/YefM family antitoxin [Pseudomonas sp. MWU13-2105]|uniref:type II toxin-antitoxin system Phd/YefM family antitoxin n=1 Tax=Pseudomonas sp. MWU13-2105 TaxID=2935074 RepID=UPI00200E5F1F|nr:type II toxin-antitoxin system Phd/YefM family antitoxin [Pseudomonas sp. MWU13-2105]